MIRSVLQNRLLLFVSRLVVGSIFLYASIDKIVNPTAFARVIYHYRLMPPDLINIWAVVLPWMELGGGLLLIIGLRTRGAALLVNMLLALFVAVLAITALRGINVSCGCFTTSTAVKSNLVLRIVEDIGIMILALHILLFRRKDSASKRISPEGQGVSVVG